MISLLVMPFFTRRYASISREVSFPLPCIRVQPIVDVSSIKPTTHKKLKLILLALPNLDAKLFAVKKIREKSIDIEIVAIAQYDDEVQALHDAGVSISFNLYGEAGHGIATHTCDILNFVIKNGRQPAPNPNFL